ncbi:aspartic peptidase domain-containing protein [Xylaria cf. heliscus]|nr:aspartic peptidase domain-containing protein [Xylaria cf. heliscus]
MLCSNSRKWRVFTLLGTLFSVLASGAVAFPSSYATYPTGVPAVNTANSFRNSGQVLTVPLKRVNHRGVATPSIARRLLNTEVFGVYGAAYLAELAIGTGTGGGQQVIDVLIDTGSFELWVNPNCSASNVPDFCKAFGHYDPTLSLTSQKINSSGFSIKYGSGQVQGPYYKDDIYISGAKVQSQQFGVANSSDLVWFGIMGLGHGQGNGFINYPLVIDSLAAQGFTNTKLFSMNLGRQISPGAVITGEMAFGGVDTNSYAGMLKKVPTDPSDQHYKIALNSLAHRAPGANSSTPFADSNLPLPLIVDSGTTLSLLPESLVSKLAAQFPGAKPDGAGGYRVPCAYQNQTGTVDFEFLSANGTATINVAYSDFIWNNGGDCFLGAWFSNDIGTFILGDSFLRGAYVAFDQTNNALFMSNRLSCGDGQSNLVAVPPGPDAAANIPGSCTAVAIPPPEPPATLVPSPMFPTGTVSNTAIPPGVSTLDSSSNSAGPANATVILTPPTSSSSSQPPPIYSPDIPPLPTINTGSPALSGGGLDATQGPSTVAGTDPNAANGVDALGDPIATVTGTITRTIVYTATACPEPAHNCPVQGKVATRFETILTTYCPGHNKKPSITALSTVTSPSTAAIPPTVIEASLPPIIELSTPPAPKPGNMPSGSGSGPERQRMDITITTAYPTTTIYPITSCGPQDASCTVGMTTTRALTTTVVKTMHVEPVPTSPPPENENGNGNGNGDGFAPGGKNNAVWNNGTDREGGGGSIVVVSAASDIRTISGVRFLAVALALVWGFVVVVVL